MFRLITTRVQLSRPMTDVDVSTIPDYLALLISGASTNAGIRSHLIVNRCSYARIALKLHAYAPPRPHDASRSSSRYSAQRFAIRPADDLRLKSN